MALDTSTSYMYRLKEPKIQELGEEAPHDIILSFDTTTSMAPFIQKLRDDLQEFVTNIFKKHPNTKIAIIAHGDYCSTYDIKTLDFTTDIKKLQKFVRSVENTNGGDFAECYELVLSTAKQMGWREGKVIKQLIMFGDAYPHDFEDFPKILKDCPLAKHQLDWRNEADDLLQMGVSIVPIQYGKGLFNEADRFWSELAYKTKSWLLEVKDPEEVRAVITVAIYKGKGTNCLQRYVKKIPVQNGGNLPDSMQVTLDRLKEIAGSRKAIALDTLSPAPAECVEETIMESDRRKAGIAADRISRHVIVTEAAREEAERRMALQAELEEKVKKIERLRVKRNKVGRKHERETEKLKEELKKQREENERINGELQKKDIAIEQRDRRVSFLGKQLVAKQAEGHQKDAEPKNLESETCRF